MLWFVGRLQSGLSMILKRKNISDGTALFVHPSHVSDFLGFASPNFCCNVVYKSILFSSPLVLLSNLDLCGFCFRGFLFVSCTQLGNQMVPVKSQPDVLTENSPLF